MVMLMMVAALMTVAGGSMAGIIEENMDLEKIE
jgi:hypothetical protein